MSATPQSSVAPVASLVIYATTPSAKMTGNHYGMGTNFKVHPRCVQAMALFRSVVLSSVTITVRQIDTIPTNKTVERDFFRFGITPRDVVFLDPATNSNVVEYIPHLIDYATTPNGTDVSITFGEGGRPFPPGLQLDLKAAEISDLHPVAFIGNCQIDLPNDADPIVSMKLDFTLKCSGEGFGAVY